MVKNYYAILGVHSKASSEDIKGAYRKRVKKLHPDHFGANSSPFLEVQEAYDVLGHTEHRRKYDRSLRHLSNKVAGGRKTSEILKTRRQWAEPLRNIDAPFDLGRPIFRRLFQEQRLTIEDLFGYRNVQSRPGQSIFCNPVGKLGLKIILTPDEARRGGQFSTSIPMEVPCPTCLGRRWLSPYECFRCMGRGSVSENLPVVVEFSPGIEDGYRKEVTLRHPGISEVSLTLIFRIGGAETFDE